MNTDLIIGRIEKESRNFFKPSLLEDKKKKEHFPFKKGDLVTSKILDKAYYSDKEKRIGKIIYIEENKNKRWNKYSSQEEPYQVEWKDGTVFSYAAHELTLFNEEKNETNSTVHSEE